MLYSGLNQELHSHSTPSKFFRSCNSNFFVSIVVSVVIATNSLVFIACLNVSLLAVRLYADLRI